VYSQFTLTAGGGGSPALILNEILANEPGSNTAGEFVEIVNAGSAAASLGGYTLRDASGTRHTFAAGTTLAAGKALVVYGAASAVPAGLSNAVGASTGTLSLANGGDTVSLRSGSGAVIATYTYGSALASVDGVSMNRASDGSASASFVLHTGISSLGSSPGKRASGASF
jgi:Lamin Tail Domain